MIKQILFASAGLAVDHSNAFHTDPGPSQIGIRFSF